MINTTASVVNSLIWNLGERSSLVSFASENKLIVTVLIAAFVISWYYLFGFRDLRASIKVIPYWHDNIPKISTPLNANQNKRYTFNKRRQLLQYPGPFPNGWYKLLDSAELKIGDRKEIECLGEVLVVFRGENGIAAALNAYCPHNGANLAGGEVVNNCIECPFHKWQFNQEGQCTHIPYEEANPPASFLKTKSWQVVEMNEMIYLYYDAEGRDAPYFPPEYEELKNGSFRYCGKIATDIQMHICEFAENSADFQHFDPLHGDMRVPFFPQLKIPGIKVCHDPSWSVDPEHGHIAYFDDAASLSFFGKRIPKSNAKARITFVGPGGVTIFRFSVPSMGDIILFHTHLPIEPVTNRVNLVWWADRKIPRFLVNYVAGSWVGQWQQDIPVWENKVFIKKPLLVKNDGPIQRMRRWYNQFYSEHSLTMKDALDTNLDW